MIGAVDLVDLAGELGLLKEVKRTGWVLKNVAGVESVSDHTWRVAMLALLLAPQLEVDQLKLVKMALVHDLGEAGVGDIRWESGGRVIGDQQQKHIDEKAVIERMFADNSGFSEYVLLWEEFNAQKTSEAKALKLIDKLEMVMQAYEYEKNQGDGARFDEFWENAEKYLKGSELEEYFLYLQAERKKL